MAVARAWGESPRGSAGDTNSTASSAVAPRRQGGVILAEYSRGGEAVVAGSGSAVAGWRGWQSGRGDGSINDYVCVDRVRVFGVPVGEGGEEGGKGGG